jgi:type IV pilus assembly protein PilY1
MKISLKSNFGLLLGILALFSGMPSEAVRAADVCSQGVGIPPFLSAGADPNLLLVLDNSGSMLDMGYIDETSQCFDESYDTAGKYAGTYEMQSWYKWTENPGSVDQWTAGHCYTDGNIVYGEGAFYAATCQAFNCASDGGSTNDGCRENRTYLSQPLADAVILWDSPTAPEWSSSQDYASGKFVTYNKQVYKAVAAVNYLTYTNPPSQDTDFTHWTPVDYTWDGNTGYSIGSIVSYKGMLYKATDAIAAGRASASIFDDRTAGGVFQWTRLDEGYFETIDDITADSCASPSYTLLDMQITLLNNGSQISGSSPPAADQVTCFRAKGNFLNWASASKFDIQKKILTGGKYSAGYEAQKTVDGKKVVDNSITTDTGDDRLIQESRGCAGKSFAKQISLHAGVDETMNTSDDVKLTLRIRGSSENDQVDTTDDRTRIELFAATVGGYDDSACQTAYTLLQQEQPNKTDLENAVFECIYADQPPASQQIESIHDKSVMDCWKIHKGDAPSFSGALKTHCESIYDGSSEPQLPQQYPWAIGKYDPFYICYGEYDKTMATKGEGFIGRCWAELPSTSCTEVACTNDTSIPITTLKADATGFEKYRCTDDLVEKCTKNVCQEKDWAKYYEDLSGDECATSSGSGTRVCEDIDNDSVDDPLPCWTQWEKVGEGPEAEQVTPAAWNTTGGGTDACIEYAEYDYCQGLGLPEVIDPSDQVFATGDTYNIPAALIDTGIYTQLGVEKPMLNMSGYLKYTLPDSQNSAAPVPQDPVERPDGPRGVLYDVAGNLRIGVMAMNANGAEWECDNIVSEDPTVIKFCPEGIKDGARVVTQIDGGMYTDDKGTPLDKTDDTENWDHYTKVIASINDARANAWTPLAEAVYSALSYYGQNKLPRLDDADYKLPSEDTDEDPWPDPVQYWCQDNHVLVITEGSSTKDVHEDVKAFAELHDDGDGAVESMCTDGLNGSTYLDNITWFGRNATVDGESAAVSNLYATLLPTHKTDPDEAAYAKQPVTTHIVTTGSLRSDGEGECSPETLMTNAAENGDTDLYRGEDPDQLEANLKRAFSEILGRASAGSAASVISSSRSGEGGVYQAIFWPQIDRPIGEKPLTWVGDVHAFFIDENGFLWDDFSGGTAFATNTEGRLWSEDKNGNGVLDDGEDLDPANNKLDGDRRVTTFFNNATNSTHICFRYNTETGECLQSDYVGTTVTSFELREFDGYLWSVKEQLQNVPDVTLNRPLIGANWDFSTNKRYIFTWNDLNNDGIVDYTTGDDNEVIGLIPSELATAADEVVSTADQPRSTLLNDFSMASQAKLEEFIEWFRGNDSSYESFDAVNGDKKFTRFEATEDENLNGVQDWVYRCRRYPSCDPTANALENPVWRLGDVIHSTPTLVARPAEGFHFIYKDPEYSNFYKKYVNRRHVVYFGANDGMLHAVNAGFFLAGAKKFVPCNEDQRDSNDFTKCAGTPYDSGGYPALGDELWAYVPYNLQKHLSCLAAPEYTAHKYFVDGPPRVFDVRIFANDDDHPGGWGTILVGYMRFGGAPIPGNDDPSLDNREFVSSYFILDITNPEKPPKLLAEMTMTDDPQLDNDGNEIPNTFKYVDLGFTTSMPAIIAMKDDTGGSEWFLVLGNGPTELTGENTGMTFSNQKGRVAVVPLNSLTGFNWKTGSPGSTSQIPFRIPNIELDGAPNGTHSGIFNLPDYLVGVDSRDESFISDIVTVDFDITSDAVIGVGVPYKVDVAYFGTTDGLGFVNDVNSLPQWSGGGRMFRLLSNQLDMSTGEQLYTYPNQWRLAPLLDAKAPITAAANVGSSGGGIFWVYFGTGRFYSPDDKTDYSQQYFFGIKEPVDQATCLFTWDDVDWWPSTGLRTPDPGNDPGEQGLLRTDPVKVIERGSFNLNDEDSLVFCEEANGDPCTLPEALGPLPSGGTTYYPFASLEKYIVGERCGATPDSANGIDGWYRKLTDTRERSLSMPTLLGGLATFTTYQPSDDLCTAEGSSFLYAAYSRTGTAWNEDVIGIDIGDHKIVRVRLDLGKGLALTPSLQTGTGDNAATAYVQTSTGDIVKIEQKELPFNTYKSGRQSWRGK